MLKKCVVCDAEFHAIGSQNTCGDECLRIRRKQVHDEHKRRNGLLHEKPEDREGPELPFPEVVKRRRCLKCDEWFDSRGKANRLCGDCNIENERQQHGLKYRTTREELAERIEAEKMDHGGTEK